MPSWAEVETEVPVLADRARALLSAHTHLTLATLRRDGSPRITGTEIRWSGDDLWIGSMFRSRKSLDLLADPRFSLHSASVDPPAWVGDARVSGRAIEMSDPATVSSVLGESAPPGPLHLFRLDVDELVVVRLGDEATDHLLVESWTPRSGLRSVKRY